MSCLIGIPEDLKECDVYCTGGGMELDVESQENLGDKGKKISAANAFGPRRRSNTSGRVSVNIRMVSILQGHYL
ncbi:unnamed protein product [Eruca vesicaria subsp. sativa]|uniref:Uncharacterized protein n=1 Tax=Eruca vesicaria subsp. sativa TaxID=29727 RepID=A0ABC8JS91_ERUVS|nr:unnamed protein product [Eruca vesicaria subsp. sativa]